MSNSARPTGSADDLRAASNLTTTLSGYLITAALAVLGGQAIVVTFVIDKRNELEAFYAVSAVGTASLVCSIILGGAGIYEIVQAGARGEWKVSTKGGKFIFKRSLHSSAQFLLSLRRSWAIQSHPPESGSRGYETFASSE